jgi:hypothetical protein
MGMVAHKTQLHDYPPPDAGIVAVIEAHNGVWIADGGFFDFMTCVQGRKAFEAVTLAFPDVKFWEASHLVGLVGYPKTE